MCMAALDEQQNYVTSLQTPLGVGLEDAKMWLDFGDSRQGPPFAAEAGCAFCASSTGRSRLQ